MWLNAYNPTHLYKLHYVKEKHHLRHVHKGVNVSEMHKKGVFYQYVPTYNQAIYVQVNM